MTAPSTTSTATTDGVRLLGPGDQHLLCPFFRDDPVTHCLVAARVAEAGLSMEALGGYLLGYQEGDQLRSALLVSANLVPIAVDAATAAQFAQHLSGRRRRASCIVGPQEEVSLLWEGLAPGWGPARDMRPEQPVLVARAPSDVAPDPRVRPVRSQELEEVLPSFISMFTEEVGVSPIANGAEAAYRRRVAEIIESGASFARFEDGRLIFKAELGAVTPECCQIQGVWIHPDYRGRGMAGPAMASVIELAREHSEIVSLYVNSYNEPALRAYRSSGFREISSFASILF